jgi:hypothetical protein
MRVIGVPPLPEDGVNLFVEIQISESAQKSLESIIGCIVAVRHRTAPSWENGLNLTLTRCRAKYRYLPTLRSGIPDLSAIYA